MAFHPGQRVVCVAEPCAHYARFCTQLPRKGTVYTVRELVHVEGETGVILAELKNPERCWQNAPRSEQPFHVSYFRPLLEKKTDISIFKRMLVPNQREKERVLQEALHEAGRA